MEKHEQVEPFLCEFILQLLLSMVIRHQVPLALSVNLHKDVVLHLRLHHLPLSHSKAAWTEKLLSFPPLKAMDSHAVTFEHWSCESI